MMATYSILLMDAASTEIGGMGVSVHMVGQPYDIVLIRILY